MQLVCKNCGATLNLVDRTHAVCPYCGQSFLIDEARGVLIDLSISYDDNAVTRRKMRNAKWLLLIFLLVGGFFATMIFAYNIAAKNSKFSASELFTSTEENGQILRVFCKDVFGKEYRAITKKEFAQIKYIRYGYESEDNDSLMAIYYSFTDYEDCASEEEFLKTVQVWTHEMDGMHWPSDFRMFTGLTRIDTSNSIWLSQLRFSKKAHISYVKTDDTLTTISSVLEPEYIKVLNIKNGNLDGIEEYTNLVELTVDSNMRYGTVDISGLEACTQLKSLYLHCGESYVGYESIGDLKELERLYIDHMTLSQCDFLSELPQLKELTINTGENPDLTILTNLPQLKKLIFVDDEYISANEIAKLSCLTELEELEIDINEKEALALLQEFKNLKVLSVAASIHERVGTNNTVIDLSGFSQLNNLQTLEIDNWDDSDFVGVEQLLNQPQFTSLKIGRSIGNRHHLVVDETVLVDNPSVMEIKLIQCVPIDAWTEEKIGFEFLTHYSDMKILYLDECKIENIAFICDLTNLRRCSLRENEITDFSPLQACKKLEAVDVYDNPSSDVDLPPGVIVNRSYLGIW